MKSHIEGQAKVLALCSGVRVQRTDPAPPGIHLNGFLSGLAAQPFLIGPLNAGLTDQVAPKIAVLRVGLQFLLGDLCYVAQDIGCHGPRRVGTPPDREGEQLPREVRICHKIRHLGHRQVRHQAHHAVGSLALLLDYPLQLGNGHWYPMPHQDLAELREFLRRVQVQRIAHDAEGRLIHSQGNAVAVEYLAPRRSEADETEAIVVGQPDVLVPLVDLAVVEPRQKEQQ